MFLSPSQTSYPFDHRPSAKIYSLLWSKFLLEKRIITRILFLMTTYRRVLKQAISKFQGVSPVERRSAKEDRNEYDFILIVH